MSGLWHPVGPEPASTYWSRRVLVLGVLGVVAAVVAALTAALAPASREAVPAGAAPPSVSVPPLDATPSARVTTSGSASPSALSSSSSAASASTSTASSTTSSTSTPSTATPTAAATAATSSPTATSRASTPKAAGPSDCDPRQLRVTLTGPGRLKPSQPAVLHWSAMNASATPCRVRVSAHNFSVRVFSGADRIWTSNHCPASVKPQQQELNPEQAATWPVTWNGRRSARNCHNRPETPRPGTYVATAQLSGAQPARLRMILHQ